MRRTPGSWVVLLLAISAACAAPAGDPAEGSRAAPIIVAEPVVEATATPSPKPTPAPTATPEATPTATPIPVQHVTLAFSGDVLSHTPVIAQAQANGSDELRYDYRPMFEPVAERLRAADLAICVLETPLSPDNTDLTGYPVFNAPGDLADALADAGYDGCATASNHSYDRGPIGVQRTLDELDRAGLGHAGMARSAEEADAPRLYSIAGAGGAPVTVAHLSFTYGLNGFVLPGDQPWLVNVTDAEEVLEHATRARQAGADIVVLSIQWGAEYVTEPNSGQPELAELLTASDDIDLIIGNHAHVIQPIAYVNDKVVVYGLGNFLSNQSGACCPTRSQDGMIVEVRFTGTEADGYLADDITVVPTWVNRGDGYRILAGPDAIDDETTPDWLRTELDASMARTIETVRSLEAPVSIAGAG